MASNKFLKVAMLTTFSIIAFGWVISATFSTALGEPVEDEQAPIPELIANAKPDDYLGSDSCMACHEDQFKKFQSTKHASLKDVPSWKNKVQGCESCHGPGKQHVEGAGDKTKIISFAGKTSKQISDSCLTCHSGKEAHNNFRRGEHFRNNVGCTDCHTAHGSEAGHILPGSITQVGDVSVQKPGQAIPAMLKSNEPQLCIACHTETKAQFSKPFRHKVLEGTIKCSDCHNAHGGVESKQTKLSLGADASCLKCHTDKQGPFVFEHAPVKTEGCVSCHTPHGSNNAKLLKRSNIRQLCMECHTNLSGANDDAPQAPHRQNTLRYQTCNTCHSKVHGSNSSSLFFR